MLICMLPNMLLEWTGAQKYHLGASSVCMEERQWWDFVGMLPFRDYHLQLFKHV